MSPKGRPEGDSAPKRASAEGRPASAILVVRPSSLGDVVHALSLVTDVADAHPGMAIDWVAEEAFVELPALSPHVRRVIPLALRRWRHAPLAAATWREIAAFRRDVAREAYDAILDLQEQVKGGVVACMARGTRHGFNRASIREPIATLFDDVHHAVPRGQHFAQRCRMLAAAALGHRCASPPRWMLRAPEPGHAPADRPAIVALHSTSRESKLWPEERWRRLLGAFADGGFATVLPWGSAAERERSERLADGIAHAVVPPRQTLSALAALIAHAELAVGVDTGLTHLAAALGTPTVAIFTETDPAGAGVAIAGTHARDLGGNGVVPSLADVQAAAGALLRATPRC
jgi:heptosyltransferase-1